MNDASRCGWACVRHVAVVLGLSGLCVAGFVEVMLLFPVSWLIYASIVATIAAGVLGAKTQRRLGIVGVGAVTTAAVVLFTVPWSSRKPFLRDLWSLRPGMTVTEVRARMASYILGTGWPADPLVEGLDGNELTLENALVFRHSDCADFNSDWGIVHFRAGRVDRIEFLAD